MYSIYSTASSISGALESTRTLLTLASTNTGGKLYAVSEEVRCPVAITVGHYRFTPYFGVRRRDD